MRQNDEERTASGRATVPQHAFQTTNIA